MSRPTRMLCKRVSRFLSRSLFAVCRGSVRSGHERGVHQGQQFVPDRLGLVSGSRRKSSRPSSRCSRDSWRALLESWRACCGSLSVRQVRGLAVRTWRLVFTCNCRTTMMACITSDSWCGLLDMKTTRSTEPPTGIPTPTGPCGSTILLPRNCTVPSDGRLLPFTDSSHVMSPDTLLIADDD